MSAMGILMKKPPGAAAGGCGLVLAAAGRRPGRNPRARYIPSRGASRCQAEHLSVDLAPLVTLSCGMAGLKIFVSYTSADRDWAHWIAWTLKEAGHEPFV